MNRRRGTGLLTAGLLAYLIGSFPTADVVSKYVAARRGQDAHIDLRETGTKNPGALNAAKVLGTKWGLVILAGDVLKGLLGAIVGRRVGGNDGAYVAGVASVAGHCFPITTGFRGGKGVATSAGTSIACFPAYMPFDLALAGGSLALSKGQAGLATYLASGVFTAVATYWWRTGKSNLWGPKATKWLPIYAAASSGIIAYKFLTAPPVPTDEAVGMSEDHEPLAAQTTTARANGHNTKPMPHSATEATLAP
jgi:glycerol-3-phosphate acyltransferase PlsY